MKKTFALATSVFALAVLTASPAAAREIVSIPVEGVVYGNEGEIYPVASGTVPEEYVGWACDGQAVTDNNGSVHPNNDLIITSGGTTVTIENIEDAPGASHEISGSVVFAETIEVSVQLGPDGVSSGGFVISFACDDPAATTTTAAPATTVAPEPSIAPEPSGPTTIAVTTTIAVAPVTTAPAPAGPSATLPVTGASTTYLIASSGMGLLAAGVALLALVQLTASRIRVNRVR